MDPMTAFLLAMQAAGLVTSILGTNSQNKQIQTGKKLEQEQFSTNLEAIRLQSAESSLDEMKTLRKNIGSQVVNQAARGNRGGTSYAGISKSVSNFNSDERTRRMNLLAKESELRAGHILSGLHTAQSETQLGQSLTKDILNTLPTTSLLKPEWFKTSKTKSADSVERGVNDLFSWGY